MNGARNRTLLIWPAALLVMAVPGAERGPSIAAGGGLGPGLGKDNHVNVLISRTDDFPSGSFDVFTVGGDVVIPNVPGVTCVMVTSTGGLSLELVQENDPGHWFGETSYGDLAAMKAAVDGTWTISISGDSPSTSTFSFNAGLLENSDFFQTATALDPTHGASCVSPAVVFEWSGPVGATPDALFVHADSQKGGETQEDNSIMGRLEVNDTSWDPPLDLSPGSNVFGILYLDFDDAGLVGALMTSDEITWGDSPFAPKGYPASTPLLVLGSQMLIGFDVGSCQGDIDLDGTVGVGDLLALFANWGPCQ